MTTPVTINLDAFFESLQLLLSNIKNGIQLAVDKHNVANPGCQVQLKTFDTEGDPQKATQIAIGHGRDQAALVIDQQRHADGAGIHDFQRFEQTEIAGDQQAFQLFEVSHVPTSWRPAART